MAIEELGHIGDGVYLSFDGYQYWLAVNHHDNKVVALTFGVMIALIQQTTLHQESLKEHDFGRPK